MIGDKTAVYVAGPMSNIPKHNFPAFDAAAAKLRGMGYAVISPAEMDDPAFRRSAMRSKTGSLNEGLYRTTSWGELLSRDVKLIADGPATGGSIDAIVVIDGWENSKGARLETFVARLAHKPIFRFTDDGELEPVPEKLLRKVHGNAIHL